MTATQLLLIALGVSADAFAVSVVQGTTITRHFTRRILHLALVFAAFQAVMPLIGWALGSAFDDLISSVDHWIAFGLLAGIGARMALDSVRSPGSVAAGSVLVLGFATSVDALAVGISFAMVPVAIVPAVILIGVTTFLASLLGGWIGHHGGRVFGRPATFIGGVVLIAIGVSILVEHLTV